MKKQFLTRLLISIAMVITTYSNYSLANYSDDLETIVVTATRSTSTLEKIDSSISVLGQDEIERTGHQHINQIFHSVPGGWISRGNGQEHLTAIRSPVFTGAGGCGAFFVAQDGISSRAPGFCNANQLFDLNTVQAARIEVMRGPNSIFYGSNAVHGLINVITPEVNTISNQLSGEVGGYGYYRLLGAASYTESTSGIAVQANIAKDEGYQNDSGFDQQKVTVIHQDSLGDWQIKSVLSATNLDQETAGFIQGKDAYRDDSLRRVNLNPEAFRESQSARAYSEWQTDITDGQIKITPYVRWANMKFLQHFLPWKGLEENSQRSVGVQGQVQKSFNEFDATFGLDIDLTQGDLRETQKDPFAPTIPQGEHYDYSVDALLISPFISATWNLNKSTQLNAGARFDSTRYDYDNRLSDGDACAPEVANCRFTRPSDQTVDFKQWSWRAGVLYSISEEQSLFANVTSGYRAPQTSELFRLQRGQTVANLDAEEALSVEAGWRGFWNGMHAELVGYKMTKENVIFQDTNRQNVSNAETKHMGIELSLRKTLFESLIFDVNLGFAEHTYEKNWAISNDNIQGNYIDTAPKLLAGARLYWQISENLDTRFEWVHMDKYYLDPENTAIYSGHNLFNLHTRWSLSQNVSFSLNINNIFDRDYAERADLGFGNYRYFVGLPRTAFLVLRYSL